MLLRFVVLASLALLAGCVNMSTLQTARALPQGQGRVLVGGGYYESKAISTADGAETLTLPYAEVGYRRGIAPNLEAGAKVTIPGTIGADAKYQLVDQDGFALAVGLGASYLKLSSEDASGNELDSLTIIDTQVPLYVSYDVGEYLSVYASPKYVARAAFSDEDSGLAHLVGVSGGVRLGKDKGIFLETTYMKSLSDSDFDALQFTGAVYF